MLKSYELSHLPTKLTVDDKKNMPPPLPFRNLNDNKRFLQSRKIKEYSENDASKISSRKWVKCSKSISIKNLKVIILNLGLFLRNENTQLKKITIKTAINI